jgi:hypothetical protein
MTRRPCAILLLAAFLACRTTELNAVHIPAPAVAVAPDDCVPRCDPQRREDREAWLECVRKCPGVTVNEGMSCAEAGPVPGAGCTEADVSQFSTGRTVALSASLAGAVMLALIVSTVGAYLAVASHGPGGNGGGGGSGGFGGSGGSGGGSGGFGAGAAGGPPSGGGGAGGH